VSDRKHTCAVDATGELWCWGGNDDNELAGGDDNADEQLRPFRIAALGKTVTDVVAAETGTCAQTLNGPRCWGDNFFGQLGDGTTVSRSTPTPVVSLDVAARPAMGTAHSCALSDGEVYCWGDNARGELGLGTFAVAPSPVAVAFL